MPKNAWSDYRNKYGEPEDKNKKDFESMQEGVTPVAGQAGGGPIQGLKNIWLEMTNDKLKKPDQK